MHTTQTQIITKTCSTTPQQERSTASPAPCETQMGRRSCRPCIDTLELFTVFILADGNADGCQRPSRWGSLHPDGSKQLGSPFPMLPCHSLRVISVVPLVLRILLDTLLHDLGRRRARYQIKLWRTRCSALEPFHAKRVAMPCYQICRNVFREKVCGIQIPPHFANG